MNKELEALYAKELISEIVSSSDGCGRTTAGAVAEYFSSVEEFFKADNKIFKKITNSKGRPVLSDDKILSIIENKKNLPTHLPVSQIWIYYLARSFIQNQIKNLNEMSFDNLDINPLLVKALEIRDPKDVIKFNLYQSITRSVVTSWGTTVEKMIKFSGCSLDEITVGSKGRRPDVKKVYQGKAYYFQIKSGPNTMNVDMIESLNAVIEAVELAGDKGLLGMTYGKRSRISPQILGNLKNVANRTKIGRELWDFISESRDYHKVVIKVIDIATSKQMNKSYINLIDEKIEHFYKDWMDKFGKISLNEALEDYI